MPTFMQKEVFNKLLLEGNHIVPITRERFAVRDSMCNTYVRIKEEEFRSLKHILVKKPIGHSFRFVLSPSKILKLRGNTWFKKQYKEHRKNNSYEQPTGSTS
jgi:hypothetical protein